MPALSHGVSRGSTPAGAAALVLVLRHLGPAAAAGQDGEAREHAAKAPRPSESLLLDVAVRDGRVVAVGERGHILVSTDDGANRGARPTSRRGRSSPASS